VDRGCVGAVICGVEKSELHEVTVATTCRRSYGIVVKRAFPQVTYEAKDMRLDLVTKQAMAEGQLLWMLDKGQLLLSDAPTTVSETVVTLFKSRVALGGSISIRLMRQLIGSGPRGSKTPILISTMLLSFVMIYRNSI
jgi:hypothetical protein